MKVIDTIQNTSHFWNNSIVINAKQIIFLPDSLNTQFRLITIFLVISLDYWALESSSITNYRCNKYEETAHTSCLLIQNEFEIYWFTENIRIKCHLEAYSNTYSKLLGSTTSVTRMKKNFNLNSINLIEHKIELEMS